MTTPPHQACTKEPVIVRIEERQKFHDEFAREVQEHMKQQTQLMTQLVQHTEQLVHIREDLAKETQTRSRETQEIFKRLRDSERMVNDKRDELRQEIEEEIDGLSAWRHQMRGIWIAISSISVLCALVSTTVAVLKYNNG